MYLFCRVALMLAFRTSAHLACDSRESPLEGRCPFPNLFRAQRAQPDERQDPSSPHLAKASGVGQIGG